MEAQFFIIAAVAIVVGAICKSRNITPALPLIAGGFLIELLGPDLIRALPDNELILTLILTPLVFAAGLASSAVDLRQVRTKILMLAVVLVIITTGVVGGITAMVLAVPLGAACALGAILSPTDAVAAGAVAKKTGLPRRVLLVIEGESLANDGTALTLLRVAVIATAVGSVTFWQASGIFALAVGVGALVGVIGGWLVTWMMRLAGKEPIVANCILLITPMALYEASEHLEGSGLLTVVIAGVWIAHAGDVSPNYQTRLQAKTIWEMITFLLESFAFVLVGAEFLDTYRRIGNDPGPIKLLVMAFLLALLIFLVRSGFMLFWFILGPKLQPDAFADRRTTRKDFVAVAMLGVRGPISVLAAFSLPAIIESGEPFPARDLILILTFAVVIISLLLSAVSTPIIRRLHLNTQTDQEALHAARVAIAEAALKRLDELVIEAELDNHPYNEKLVIRLRSMAKRRIDSLKASPERKAVATNMAASQRHLQYQMLQAERHELHRLRSENRAPGEVVTQLTHELDVREAALGQTGRLSG